MPGSIASPPKVIGIAVVTHAGQVLVGVRGPQSPLAGMAEYPGGKCEPGEAPDACAVRECLEETGLPVKVVGTIDEAHWTYPHGAVHLHFFHCRPTAAADVRPDHQGFRWTPASELEALQFPEANQAVLARVVELAEAEIGL